MLEKTLESPLDCKEVKPVNSKGNQSWIFIGRTDTEAGAPIFWLLDAKNWLTGKDPDCRERLKAGEGDDRGWDGWMASPTWWTWVWASSGSWWWTGRPGVLQSMGSQRVRHDWETELNWIEDCLTLVYRFSILLSSHMAWGQIQGAHSPEICYIQIVPWATHLPIGYKSPCSINFQCPRSPSLFRLSGVDHQSCFPSDSPKGVKIIFPGPVPLYSERSRGEIGNST